MKKAIIAAAILAATTTVHGADEPFTGAFIGGEAGYMDAGNDVDGLYYGAFGGIRKQTASGFVYGIEGSFGTSSADVLSYDDVIDHQWSAMATAGWAFGEESKNLFSLGAGYAQAKVSVAGYSDTGDGFAAMAGYDRAIGKNMNFRVRMTTYDFDTVIGTAGFGFRF